MNVGVEIELTDSTRHEPTYKQAGEYSEYVLQQYRDRVGNWPGATVTYDGTVGTEIVMNGPMDIDNDPGGWFRDSLDYAEREYNCVYEPCGLMGSRGSTAGLHIHMSPLTEDEARKLYSMSEQPWMKVFACSSITEDDFSVFRGDSYCNFDGRVGDGDRYTAVRSIPGDEGHYEWRLPEPMSPEHFEMLMEFLRRFKYSSPEEAAEYARGFVEDADSYLTSIRRAEEVGVLNELTTHDNLLNVSRSPFVKTDDFFWDVMDNSSTPYIFRAYEDGEQYYTFYSRSYEDDFEFTVNGVQFELSDTLDAKTLKPVRDSVLQERIDDSLQNHVSRNASPRQSEATEKLLAVMQ